MVKPPSQNLQKTFKKKKKKKDLGCPTDELAGKVTLSQGAKYSENMILSDDMIDYVNDELEMLILTYCESFSYLSSKTLPL